MQTQIVKSGYARTKSCQFEVREMTVEEAKNLVVGSHISFLDVRGELRQCKVNGRPKTWKTRPNNCTVPVKYGLYEYDYFYWEDGKQLCPCKAVIIIGA